MLDKLKPKRFILAYPRITSGGEEIYRKQCAWCGRVTDGLGKLRTGEKISHGICPDCVAECKAKSPYYRGRRERY